MYGNNILSRFLWLNHIFARSLDGGHAWEGRQIFVSCCLFCQCQVQPGVDFQGKLRWDFDKGAFAALENSWLHQAPSRKVEHAVFHQISLPVLPSRPLARVEVQGLGTIGLFPPVKVTCRPAQLFVSGHTKHWVVAFFKNQGEGLLSQSFYGTCIFFQ